MHSIVIIMHNTKSNETKNLFNVHPDPEKKTKSKIIMTMVKIYIAAVDANRIHCQMFEPSMEFSQLLRQVSDHECAKSTNKTRPMRMKRTEPMAAT